MLHWNGSRRAASFWPIFPKPIIPIVFPYNSLPFFWLHIVFEISSLLEGTFLKATKICIRASSATDCLLVPSLKPKAIDLSFIIFRSILFKPTPNLLITFKLGSCFIKASSNFSNPTITLF